jgi:hypothetical protein
MLIFLHRVISFLPVWKISARGSRYLDDDYVKATLRQPLGFVRHR